MDAGPEIRLLAGSTVPVGPPFWGRLLRGEFFREHAGEILRRNQREYGDLVFYKGGGVTVMQVNHPELIGELLTRDASHHNRNKVMQTASAVLGDGLLTSEEPLHMRQRRLAAPAFHRQRIAAYGEVIGQRTVALTAGWRDGETVDARAAMLRLALEIVGKTLFDIDVQDEAEVARIAAAVDSFQYFMPLSFLPFNKQIQKMPLPAMRAIRRGREHLDKLIYGIIAERRKDPVDRGDLVSMLLASTDADNPKLRMTDAQVRDECVTILLAGHETTANALSFALLLLAQHAEVQEALAAESQRVLQGRVPTAADYPALKLAEQVFAEAMRLYPPVWVTARVAARAYEYRGFTVPKGTMLLAPQYVVHRDPRWWAEPDQFDPSRFTAEAKAARPKLSYFPFGGGGRQCIGEGLAWMEGALVLAGIVQDWRLSVVAGDVVKVDPAISLRPKGPVRLVLARR